MNLTTMLVWGGLLLAVGYILGTAITGSIWRARYDEVVALYGRVGAEREKDFDRFLEIARSVPRFQPPLTVPPEREEPFDINLARLEAEENEFKMTVPGYIATEGIEGE